MHCRLGEQVCTAVRNCGCFFHWLNHPKLNKQCGVSIMRPPTTLAADAFVFQYSPQTQVEYQNTENKRRIEKTRQVESIKANETLKTSPSSFYNVYPTPPLP